MSISTPHTQRRSGPINVMWPQATVCRHEPLLVQTIVQDSSILTHANTHAAFGTQ
jgi:hypothetical protein